MKWGKERRLHLFTILVHFEKQGQFCGLGDKNKKTWVVFVLLLSVWYNIWLALLD
jgi:hypothetical protein